MDGFRFRQLFQDLLLVLAERLPGRFGRGLHGQNSFQRRQRIGMVADRTFHGRQDIIAVIGSQQGQDSPRLVLAVPLFLQQSLQEAAGRFAEFSEPLAENGQLFGVIPGRTMIWVDASLSGLTEEQRVPGKLLDPPVVDEQFGLGHAHRQEFAHQPPGR